jgi:hypothetical protein
MEGPAGAAAPAPRGRGALTNGAPGARFRLLPGEVRARSVAQGGRGAELEGTLERAARRYEGPFGPIEIALGEKLRVTRVWGPLIPTLTLPWGPASPEDPAAKSALRQGLRCQMGAEEWTFRQPAFGIPRGRRAIHVTAPHRSWTARVRSLATLSLEREDTGAWIARLGLSRSGELAPSFDRDDVLVAVLLFGSNLIAETELGYAPF